MLPSGFVNMSVNVPSMFNQLFSSFGWTILLFVTTLLLSLPLGLLVAFARMSTFTPLRGLIRWFSHFSVLRRLARFAPLRKTAHWLARFSPLRWLAKLYISIMRGTPLMLQLMVVFFGPHYLFGLELGLDYRIWAAIIGFTINYSAYFAEIYRGGIESMPKGQYEAAAGLGFGRVQTVFRIIFPQVLRNILPAITSEVITLVKDTSLAQVISYTEIFGTARKISSTSSSIMPYFAAGGFYYFTNLIIAFVMERLEKRMDYTKRDGKKKT